MAGMEGGGVN